MSANVFCKHQAALKGQDRAGQGQGKGRAGQQVVRCLSLGPTITAPFIFFSCWRWRYGPYVTNRSEGSAKSLSPRPLDPLTTSPA